MDLPPSQSDETSFEPVAPFDLVRVFVLDRFRPLTDRRRRDQVQAFARARTDPAMNVANVVPSFGVGGAVYLFVPGSSLSGRASCLSR